MNLDTLFNDIYNKTYNSIFRYILSKCHNLSDIDDIIQDIYTDFYFILEKKAHKIENYEAYLMKITKNKIYKYYIYENKIKDTINDYEMLLTIPDNFKIEQATFEKFTTEDIWNETKNLNIITQKILILYFKEEYKINEIAQFLEINESTVKTKLYRGINDLKDNLRREYE